MCESANRSTAAMAMVDSRSHLQIIFFCDQPPPCCGVSPWSPASPRSFRPRWNEESEGRKIEADTLQQNFPKVTFILSLLIWREMVEKLHLIRMRLYERCKRGRLRDYYSCRAAELLSVLSLPSRGNWWQEDDKILAELVNWSVPYKNYKMHQRDRISV